MGAIAFAFIAMGTRCSIIDQIDGGSFGRREAVDDCRHGMTWQMALTAGVLFAVLILRDRVAPAVSVMGALLLLVVTGVLDAKRALAGFSNPAPASVAAFYVIATALKKTGAFEPVVAAVLGDGNGARWPLVRLLVPSATASACVDNTPLVATLVAPITEWAERRGLAPSRFLLPMTYAISMGGTITLIGTSTNLVASGLLEAAGQRPLGMFEQTPVGLPAAIVGVLALILVGPWVLPDRRAARRHLEADAREFLVSMVVIPGGPLEGKTVEHAGLRHLQGVFVVEIVRAGRPIAPVAPTAVLEGGDRLTFVGKADQVIDLQAIRGLSSSEKPHLSALETFDHAFFEAVIGPSSPLVGKTLKQATFRASYAAAVIAIHRAGHRIAAKLGDVRLRAGDTLLFIADPGFRRNDFLLVLRVGNGKREPRRKGGVLVSLLLLAVVVATAIGLITVLKAAFLAVLTIVALRILSPSEVREAINFDVILLVAGSLGLAAAMDSSGLADAVARAIVTTCGALGPRGALAGVVLFTIALAQVLTCNAAVALAFPFGLAAASHLGLNPRAFAIAMTVSASITFLTPLGYQTKLMVYGPGGYRFGDYFRLGALPTLAIVVVIVAVVSLGWGL